MIKNSLVIAAIILIVFSGCGIKNNTGGSGKVVLGKTPVVSYHSLGNGVADISLILFENDTFRFVLESIPQPGTREKPVRIREKGSYQTEDNWRILYFSSPGFALDAVFDPQFSDGNDFLVIDEKTLKINEQNNTLFIWGIACEKQ